MTQAADRIFRNAELHTLTNPDETYEAVAVRDGEIVRVDSEYEIEFLEGVETDVVDCGGGVLLPGFIDAHTHVEYAGKRLVHADLAGTTDREEALDRIRESADDEGWIIGFGYDESTWPESEYLTREELDGISTDQPVVAFREDMHTASVNSVVLERYADEMGENVQREGGEPTGVVTEDAASLLGDETAPDREAMGRLLSAAQSHAHSLGITGVHDMVRNTEAPGVYREMELDGELALRVRLYYWETHFEAVEELGLRTNHGSEFVEVGGIKSFTDGALGARTAKLYDPYEDGEGTGEWVVTPEALAETVDDATELDLQVAVHAIGDEAVDVSLETLPDDPSARHRIEHAELVGTELSGFHAVASMQPNFLKWAREGGLYDSRIGPERSRASNPFAEILEEGVPLAFGSDCMPMNPLYGIQQAVTARDDRQRLTVTQALRAYTSGAAYAGFDEDRLGTIEPGKRADFVLLSDSPWETPNDEIADIVVAKTIVDGSVVYENE